MAFLLDTNLLLRLTNARDAMHAVAARAIAELHRRGELLHLTPQVLIEYRNVATRPVAVNGLGLTITQAEAQAASFESMFSLLTDTPDIYPAWKSLVAACGTIGKRVHDARIVSVCHVHGISHLLTFNSPDFVQLSVQPPGVTIVDPASV